MGKKLNDITPQASGNVPPKKKNKIRIGLFLFFSLPATLLVAVLILVSLITGEPTSYPLPPLTAEVMRTQLKAFQLIYPEVSKDFPADQAEIELTESEVGDLLIIARHAHALSHAVSPREINPNAYRIKYQDGKFKLNYSYQYGSMNFNFYAEVIPNFDSNGISVKPTVFKVGKLRLPRRLLISNAEVATKRFQNNDDYKRFFRIIVSVEIRADNSLRIVYRPAQVAELVWGFKKDQKKLKLACISALSQRKLNTQLLLFLVEGKIDPEKLRNIPPFSFDKSILGNVTPKQLPLGVFAELQSGIFDPGKLIPLLQKHNPER